MKVNHRVHQLKIVFNITPQIERFVYIYLIEGKDCYLIDTGVKGSERLIADYMTSIGRDFSEISAIFLTHSHPDHIGAANAIQTLTLCAVYACEGERHWMEDIDQQFKDRPIPNFYGLLDKPAQVDVPVQDGDTIKLEAGLTLQVLETSGHSRESLSYYLVEDKLLFTGDAVPVPGDIPIYISAFRSMETIKKIQAREAVEWYCSAWDQVHNYESGQTALQNALAHLEMIDHAVKQVIKTGLQDPDEVFASVCEQLNMKHFLINPLFKTSILANIENK